MNFKIIYNPDIYNDIQEAIDWYNEQQSGLGVRFYNVLQKQLKSLTKDAFLYAIRYDDVRCLPLKAFPYMIHYRVDMTQRIVKVEAVIHTGRDPHTWYKKTGKD